MGDLGLQIAASVCSTSVAESSDGFLVANAFKATSLRERIPQSLPFASITGSRRTCFSRMICKASRIGLSGAQEKTLRVMTSLTPIIAGGRFLQPAAMQTSRSVSTPTICPSLPTTGRTPQSRVHIVRAAVERSSLIPQIRTSLVMTSFTVMALLFLSTKTAKAAIMLRESCEVLANS